MNIARCTLAALPSPDYHYIYAVGGFNGNALNIVERYSTVTDQWEFTVPMKRPRFMHGCCFVKKKKNNIMSVDELSID